jgi:predicted DCC family thiol-disulfide oxidoreductase YuxK
LNTKAVILFDGVCNLCNSSVLFVIKHDTKHYFSFAALQSNFGQELLKKHSLNPADFDSLVLYDKDKVYLKSSAVLRLTRNLRFPFPLCYALILIPAFLRNIIYDFIAKNRYKWFGKKDSCMIPSAELEDRFIA